MTASRLYREFVAAGMGQTRRLWDDLRAKLYLGSETFIARIEELTAARERTTTEPALQRNLRAIDGTTIQRLVEATFGHSLTPGRRVAARRPRAADAP